VIPNNIGMFKILRCLWYGSYDARVVARVLLCRYI